MPALTQETTLGDLLKREYDADYCRETIALAAGDALPAGAVLGRIAATGVHVLSPAAAAAGQEGAEIACAVLLEPAAASGAARTALALVRGPAIVADGALVFASSVDDADKRAAKIDQLAAHGIVARKTV